MNNVKNAHIPRVVNNLEMIFNRYQHHKTMDPSFFKDRRGRGTDRRQQNRIEEKPASGCRRTSSRRNRQASTDPKPWWLKVSYTQEVSAAVVRSNQRPKLYRNEDTETLQNNSKK